MTDSCEQTDSSSISLILVEDDVLAAKRLFEVPSRPEGTRFEITRVNRIEDALVMLQNRDFDDAPDMPRIRDNDDDGDMLATLRDYPEPSDDSETAEDSETPEGKPARSTPGR